MTHVKVRVPLEHRTGQLSVGGKRDAKIASPNRIRTGTSSPGPGLHFPE
jgi:hypothetical protein